MLGRDLTVSEMGWGLRPGNPRLVSMTASYHKEQYYIWFRGGDLNSVQDIKPYVNWRQWAYPGGSKVWVIQCTLSLGTTTYMV